MKKDNSECNDIPALVKTINDNPDILHLDYTPSVHQLTECGLEAIQAILPLLNSKDEWERFRAQRVMEGVVMKMYGWKAGQGYPKESNEEEKVAKILKENGNYNADNSKQERSTSIKKWEKWIKNN